MARGIMIVESSPVSLEREEEYNTWYSQHHIPEVCGVPGITAARRYRKQGDGTGLPRYVAIYELEADDLSQPLKELSQRTADGRLGAPSDSMQMDPPPVVTVCAATD